MIILIQCVYLAVFDNEGRFGFFLKEKKAAHKNPRGASLKRKREDYNYRTNTLELLRNLKNRERKTTESIYHTRILQSVDLSSEQLNLFRITVV